MFDQMVILAGGLGKRLRPLTLNTPKPLVALGQSENCLDIIIKHAHSQGIQSFIVLAGFNGDRIKEHCLRYKSVPHIHVEVVITPAEFTTSERVLHASDKLRGDILIAYGDNISEIDYSELHALFASIGRCLHVAAPSRPEHLGNMAFQEVRGKIGIGQRQKAALPSKVEHHSTREWTDIGLMCQSAEIAIKAAQRDPALNYQDNLFYAQRPFSYMDPWPYFTLTDQESMQKAERAVTEKASILLDRDGVLVQACSQGEHDNCDSGKPINIGFVKKLGGLSQYLERVIIVTNQGWMDVASEQQERNFRRHNSDLKAYLRNELRVQVDYLECPHSYLKMCGCRKPRPGMLYQAAQKGQFMRSKSLFIGDSITDSAAAREARIDFMHYDMDSDFAWEELGESLRRKASADYRGHRLCRLSHS